MEIRYRHYFELNRWKLREIEKEMEDWKNKNEDIIMPSYYSDESEIFYTGKKELVEDRVVKPEQTKKYGLGLIKLDQKIAIGFVLLWIFLICVSIYNWLLEG